ncbi:N-acetyltransferase [Phytohabitans houttuyneae]|uniref:N-acetyltransferase n=2 Tax=Phytohabitans houttuyneae TaxID=1076126 RepID=A0A6V8KRY0_9ACTN|nr:GNAT family N-acetyltransferase [Phytohabitans houttuyneae]GFJ85398.1 N-acetyltransferase [Phytohabitans houttuyneae]
MKIRTGRRDDAERLLAFWSAAAHGRSVSDDLAGVARLLRHDSESVLVAEVDGVVVGTVIAGWGGWRCHIYRLAVSPDHRRRGIGRELLAAAEARFVALGGRRSDAMVDDGNPGAHELYRNAGYMPDSSWSRWVRPSSRSTVMPVTRAARWGKLGGV